MKTDEEKKEYHRKYSREYRKKYGGTEPYKQYQLNYRKKHKRSLAEKNKIYQRNLRKSSPKHRIDNNISNGIWYCLKSKKEGRKWETLVGYTIEKLITHLEKQFDDKMSWDNYGKYWEIDHKKPKSLFYYESPEGKEFKECWAIENLQPLEKSLNRIKFNNN